MLHQSRRRQQMPKDSGSHNIFRSDWFFDNPFIHNWQQVRDEYLENVDEFKTRWHEKFNGTEDGWPGAVSGVVQKYPLAFNGEVFDGFKDLMPTLYNNLASLDRLHLATFSNFQPRCYLKPHHGDNSGIVRCHITLTKPSDADCKLFVQTDKDSIHELVYEPGKAFWFDNTRLHWAGNPSETEERINIFFDMWPLNTEMIRYKQGYKNKMIQSFRDHTNLNTAVKITPGLDNV